MTNSTAPAPAVPAFIAPRALVSWDTWTGPTTARVVSVGGYYSTTVTLKATDGVTDSLEATAWKTLAEVICHLRPATAEEAARFEARERPVWHSQD